MQFYNTDSRSTIKMTRNLAYLLSAILACASGHSAFAEEKAKEARWIHPKAEVLPTAMKIPGKGDKVPPYIRIDRDFSDGPFVHLKDGVVMTFEPNMTYVSRDGGKTWGEPRVIVEGSPPGIPVNEPMFIRTKNNVLILVYMDLSVDSKDPGYAHVWSIRSFDEGKTWVDRQKILDGYCGALVSILQTSTGEVVVPIQPVVKESEKTSFHPERNVLYTYVSEDDGKTWKRSNLIDLGGTHDHDGGTEPTLVELRDGRLWMLLRTTYEQFWSAHSSDKGRTWRNIGASGIPAAFAPGYMIRLASGRLMFIYNPLSVPEIEPKRTRNFNQANRLKLVVRFSDDDGEHWTEPTAVVTDPIAAIYPTLFEYKPGEVWISAGSEPTRIFLKLNEKDFVK